MKKYFTVKNLCLSGIIAALYAGLTILLQAISFQAVQVRVSEAMTLLPVLLPAAIPGLTVGCFLANILSPVGWMDMVFGTLATLIAAVLTRKFKKNLYLAALMPVLSNAVIIGVMLHVAFGEPLWMSMLTVGAGEALACFVLGIPLVKALEKVPGLKDE
ncbi:MAG: QueT transporter family protein [Clostridia bacterium]|nr:QueT transporter family protein [Clostridia bacterium]MBR0407923.1 QueT transporter family protein [Clostridia bacterium]